MEIDNKQIEASQEMSKRAKKRLQKKLHWEEHKQEKRAIERQKKKERKRKLQEMGQPVVSRKRLKRNKMEDSSCRVCVAVDCSFDELMTEKDIVNVVKQLNHCYAANRRAENPVQFYMTSVGQKTLSRLNQIGDYHNWDVFCRSDDYMSVFGVDRVVYLTSDSDNVLETLEDGKAYIIGGLVDHNHLKGYCLTKAKEKGVAHARLPLDGNVKLNSRNVLTINHVFEILVKFTEIHDWAAAFEQAIPKRKQDHQSTGEEGEQLTHCDHSTAGHISAQSAGDHTSAQSAGDHTSAQSTGAHSSAQSTVDVSSAMFLGQAGSNLGVNHSRSDLSSVQSSCDDGDISSAQSSHDDNDTDSALQDCGIETMDCTMTSLKKSKLGHNNTKYCAYSKDEYGSTYSGSRSDKYDSDGTLFMSQSEQHRNDGTLSVSQSSKSDSDATLLGSQNCKGDSDCTLSGSQSDVGGCDVTLSASESGIADSDVTL